MARALVRCSTFVLALASVVGSAAQSPVVPVRVGGDVRPPIKTRDVRPAYPPEAQGAPTVRRRAPGDDPPEQLSFDEAETQRLRD